MKLIDEYIREIQGGNLQKATRLMLDIMANDASGEMRECLNKRFSMDLDGISPTATADKENEIH